jgi:hypothetical protein
MNFVIRGTRDVKVILGTALGTWDRQTGRWTAGVLWPGQIH